MRHSKAYTYSLYSILVIVYLLSSFLFGEVYNWYEKFVWWDLYLHGLFGVVSALLIYNVWRRQFLTLALVLGLALAWESFEWWSDVYRHTYMLAGGGWDTLSDVAIAVTLASVVIADKK